MKRYLDIGLLLLLLVTHGSPAQHASQREVEVAYLYHFLQFVTWEELAAGKPVDEYRLCLIGKDPFGSLLDTLSERRVHDRHLRVVHVAEFDDATNCHLLYIDRSSVEDYLARVSAGLVIPALTVSDSPGFAEQGGMIGFVIINDRVRLEINKSQVDKAGLRLSAKLIEVAVRVYPSDIDHTVTP